MTRQVYALYGHEVWARETVNHYLATFQADKNNNEVLDILWLSDQHLPHKKAKGVLGQTVDVIVYECYQGFFPNAFGQVGGTLRGNGIFFLLLPELVKSTNSYFMRWVNTVIKKHSAINSLTPHIPLPDIHLRPPPIYKSTAGQQLAIQSIQTLITQAATPLVITAKRGRGKSAALGLAANAILKKDNSYRIAITAPSRLAAKTALCHANHSELNFISPDSLLKDLPPLDLLLIDEAAALPLTVLKALLAHYPRTVFATTLLGYEGSGQGFSLRFQQVLTHDYPQWQKIKLRQAIRWAEHDPLEAFIDDVLLLNAKREESFPNKLEKNILLDNAQYLWQRIEAKDLITQPELLKKVFGLLLNAHYQTKPDDLQYLLDGEHVSIFVLWLNSPTEQLLLGVLLSEQEGGFSTELAKAIVAGERRPKGHLLAQSLAFHLGYIQAAHLLGERILRIAIAEPYRRQGLASQMLENLFNDLNNADQKKIDYLGVSFAYSTELLKFWQKNDFIPVRLGLQADASSGAHSLMMIKALSKQGQQLEKELSSQFNDVLLHLMPETFSTLQTDQLINLPIRQTGCPNISKADYQTLRSFVQTHRGYEVCLPAIYRFVSQSFFYKTFLKLPETMQALFVCKVLQRKTWEETVSCLAFNGKKQAKQTMKQAVGILFDFYNEGKKNNT
jgi:tRNA(Met) cytidine acetyltransferase